MMRMGRLQLTLVPTLAVALIASGGIILRLSRQLRALQRQHAADQQSLHDMQAAIRQHEPLKAPAEAENPSPPGDLRAGLAQGNTTIEPPNRELGDAQASIAGLQAQLQESNEEREKALASASELQQKEKEDWKKQLDALKQDLESTQTDLQVSRQRLAALEADNAKLRNDTSTVSARAADFARVVAQLQDLESRRDAYLTSIMRRYRDITSQFRAMSGMLGSSRDSNSSSPFSDAALTSIQNAVSSADDDLRQLNELNAQARQLEKKLAKK